MHSVAGRNQYADLLELIPAFSTADRQVLEDYVTHSAVTIRCSAGKTLSAESDRDRNLYVVVSGTAELRAEGGVRLDLVSGDFFGGDRRHPSNVIDVVAVSDVEVLVIDPLHITHLTAEHGRRVSRTVEAEWNAPRRHRRHLVGAGW
jgi:CRP-like cAMP-binding protein